MKFKKLVIATITVLSVAVMGTSVATTNTTVYAKTKSAKVLKTSKFTTKQKVNVTGGWMYSSTKLTKKNHHMTNYLYTKFYASKKVTLKRASGKKATYTYIKSTNGKIKGYVWSGYVMNQWPTKYNLTTYKSAMVTEVNQYRAKYGLSALKQSSAYNKVAAKDAKMASSKKGKNFKPTAIKGTDYSGVVWQARTQDKTDPVLGFKNSQDMAEQVFTYFGSNQKYAANSADKYIGIGAVQSGQNFYTEVVFSPTK